MSYAALKRLLAERKEPMNVNVDTEKGKEESHDSQQVNKFASQPYIRTCDEPGQQVNKFASLPYILTCDEPGYLYASELKIHELKYEISKKEVTMKYDQNNLYVRSPIFRASVTVEIPPLPEGAHYEVGWINVVTDLKFVFTFGKDGICSRDLPELVSGKYTMLNAGDSTMFPWHSSKLDIQGPTLEPTFAPISLLVSELTKIPWHKSENNISFQANLTYVYRKEHYYTFIAIKDVNTSICQIIETLTWVAEYAIDVNPKRRLEKRSTMLVPLFDQEIARIEPLFLIPPLDSKALNPPNESDCMVQVFRPTNGHNEVEHPNAGTFAALTQEHFGSRDYFKELAKASRMKYAL